MSFIIKKQVTTTVESLEPLGTTKTYPKAQGVVAIKPGSAGRGVRLGVGWDASYSICKASNHSTQFFPVEDLEEFAKDLLEVVRVLRAGEAK